MKEIIQRPEYDFFRANPDISGKVLLLTYGGSIAYGTNNENSDTDIRGVCLNRKEDILGFNEMHQFEQFIDPTTDTVIYSLNKLTRLLISCNPNTIEILGCRPDHYHMVNKYGQMLLDNKELFLSQKAVNSFSGYARQQLARLENALARDRLAQSKKEMHILNACQSTIDAFEKRYSFNPAKFIELVLMDSEKEDFDKETFVNVSLHNVPLREFAGMAADLANVAKCYDKLNHRNSKKDDNHLNKHAMHLVRLYLMGIDILEKAQIITYRINDIPELMSIRNGKYQKEDGTYYDEFFEMVNEYEKRIKYAAKHTILPVEPDYKKIHEMISEINYLTVVDGL